MYWLLQIIMNNLYTVSEVAKKLDVSADTIRRWEKKGLIKANRSENNYRIFNIEEVKRVNNKLSGGDNKHRFKILQDNLASNYKVLDLFSGAGGTSLGFHNAGLNHVALVEIDKDACSTLRKNMPDWNVIEDDISKVSFKGMEADIIEGGFPCQAFSYAGKKLGFEDTRGTLFFEFARAINEVQPKIAIGENVKGLLRHDNGRTLQAMLNTLDEIGYKVEYKVLRSQYLDVPQKRERLIIIAVRKDLKMPIIFPKEKNYIISLKEALHKVPQSKGYKYPDGKKKILDLIPPGGYWKDLPEKIQKEYMGASFYHTGGRTGMARRLAWEEPSLTLTTSPAQKQTERCHPDETRPLTIREYARIQTFPDEWEFVGSIASQYKQIGNAVPVNLGYHIGKALKNMLDGNLEDENYIEVNDTLPTENLALFNF